MAKVVTFGELLLRLSTRENQKIMQATAYDACFGGSEANVAVSLSLLGHDAKFVTKLPDNSLGRSAARDLQRYGVDVLDIVYGGERIGVYYLEPGTSYRASNVIYDRKNSSISKASVEEFDYDRILEGADWFHFSGITPAISKECRDILQRILITAKEKNITVSCDMNFRQKLWTTKEAQEVMPSLMEYVDVCIGSRKDAEKNLGMKLTKENEDDTPNLEAFEILSKEMMEKYHFKYVVTSLRQSHTSSHNDLMACIYDGKSFYCTRKYEISPMRDRVGGGDAFSAGMIAALLDGKETKEAAEYALAASVLKHTIPGDYNLSTNTEIEALKSGDVRISR